MPLIGGGGGSVDADDTEVAVDHMSEEELLKGLEGLAPPEEQPEPTTRNKPRSAADSCDDGPATAGPFAFWQPCRCAALRVARDTRRDILYGSRAAGPSPLRRPQVDSWPVRARSAAHAEPGPHPGAGRTAA